MNAISRLVAVAGFILVATAASAQTVKIGLLAPFSGPFAIWGSQFKQAVEAFQKVHGDSVKGAKIEVIYRDNAGDPTRTRQLAEEMIPTATRSNPHGPNRACRWIVSCLSTTSRAPHGQHTIYVPATEGR